MYQARKLLRTGRLAMLGLLASGVFGATAHAQRRTWPLVLQNTTWGFTLNDTSAMTLALGADKSARTVMGVARRTITGVTVDPDELKRRRGTWYVLDDRVLCLELIRSVATAEVDRLCYEAELSGARLEWASMAGRRVDDSPAWSHPVRDWPAISRSTLPPDASSPEIGSPAAPSVLPLRSSAPPPRTAGWPVLWSGQGRPDGAIRRAFHRYQDPLMDLPGVRRHLAALDWEAQRRWETEIVTAGMGRLSDFQLQRFLSLWAPIWSTLDDAACVELVSSEASSPTPLLDSAVHVFLLAADSATRDSFVALRAEAMRRTLTNAPVFVVKPEALVAARSALARSYGTHEFALAASLWDNPSADPVATCHSYGTVAAHVAALDEPHRSVLARTLMAPD